MVAKQYQYSLSVFSLPILFSLLGFNSASAETTHQYFKSNDSTVFENIDTRSSNRNGQNPIVTVKSFDISKLVDLEEYDVKSADLEEIIRKDQKENNNRYTVDRLENLAEILSFYYKKKGLILTKVFFPPQSLKKQTLYLDIVMGEIEHVASARNEYYSDERLIRPFKDIINKPAYIPTLESSLLELNNYPGISLDTHFKEGTSIGKTQIDIRVKDERLSDFNFSFDNYGSEYTGSMRGMLKANIYNLADQADQLNINLQATFNPTNSVYFGTSYRFKIEPYYTNRFLNSLFRHGLNTTLGYQQTKYEAGAEIAEIEYQGKASTLYIKLDKDFILRNNHKFNSSFILSKKEAQTKQGTFENNKNLLSIFTWSNQLSWSDNIMSPAFTFIKFDYHQGLPGFAGALEAGSTDANRKGLSELDNNGDGIKDEIYASMDYTRYNLLISRNQSVGPYRFISKINTQYTNDLMFQSELSNLGGSGAVRGYSNSDFSGDKSTVISLELVGKSNAHKLALPISNLKLAGFIDYGVGERLFPQASETETAEMISIGGYAQFLKEGKFSSKMELAIPLVEVGDSKKNGLEVLFNFERGF